MAFIPSLKLSRMLYEEEIAPIMRDKYPGLKYAAASHGMCSESLGLDDEISMDHMWGPRISIFLSPEDHNRYSKILTDIFQSELPMTFKGFDMTCRNPSPEVAVTPGQ